MSKYVYLVLVLYFFVIVKDTNCFPWPNFFKTDNRDVCENKTLPELVRDEGEDVLYTSFKRLELLDTLKQEGITLFGPTNEAFRKMPRIFRYMIYGNKTFYEELLKYHVINDTIYSTDLSDNLLVDTLAGQKIRINMYQDGKIITASGAPIIKANLNASNGVLHEVGNVMIPPFGDIMGTLKLMKSFSCLVQALESANLTTDLNGNGTFTLFAPINKAFRHIMPLPTNKTVLSDILQYHFTSDVLYSAGFMDGQQITTENGNNVTVSIKRHRHRYEKEICVNKAKVLLADFTCTNGVIHVIDEVLMPPSQQTVPSFTVVDTQLKFRSFWQILGF